MNPDPIAQAMQDLLNKNLVAAQDVRIRQLEDQVAALRKELADAQENYHVVNGHCARLKAEVERLTKAGDAMASRLMDGGVIISGHILAEDWFKAKWHPAKEGKQP